MCQRRMPSDPDGKQTVRAPARQYCVKAGDALYRVNCRSGPKWAGRPSHQRLQRRLPDPVAPPPGHPSDREDTMPGPDANGPLAGPRRTTGGIWHLPLEARRDDPQTVLGCVAPAAAMWVADASRTDDVLVCRPRHRALLCSRGPAQWCRLGPRPPFRLCHALRMARRRAAARETSVWRRRSVRASIGVGTSPVTTTASGNALRDSSRRRSAGARSRRAVRGAAGPGRWPSRSGA